MRGGRVAGKMPAPPRGVSVGRGHRWRSGSARTTGVVIDRRAANDMVVRLSDAAGAAAFRAPLAGNAVN
jgi:hypothetical protein